MKNKLILILFIFIASWLRLFQLGSVPIELNRDEASLGYTAYSLLKTGADEYGKTWPLNLESFGDWKLPVYVWTSIPSILIFDLTAWSVRLPSAIAGVAAVVLIYQLSLLLISNSKNRHFFALLAAFILALTPWHIHFSRMAYEANLGLTLLLAGLLMFFKFNHTKKSEFLVFGSVFFALTMICYHAMQIITPLILLSLLIFFRQTLFKKDVRHLMLLILSAAIVLLPIFFLFSSETKLGNDTKLSGISIFDQETYFRRTLAKRQYFKDNQLLIARTYTNIPLELLRQLFVNGTTAFNPDFLFINGAGHGSHDISGMGKLLSITTPFLLVGMATVFTSNTFFKKKTALLIYIWLIIGVLPAIITWEPAHSTRSFVIILPLILLIIQGVYWFYHSYYKTQRIAFLIGLSPIILILSFQVVSMLTTYFIVAPQRDSNNWTWYAQDMVKFIDQAKTKVDHVYVQGNSWSPYIYYLFYAKINPLIAQKQLIHLAPDAEGFRHVSKFDNIEFGDIPFQHLLEAGESYAVFARNSQLPSEFSQNPTQFDQYQVYSNTNSQESYVAILKN